MQCSNIRTYSIYAEITYASCEDLDEASIDHIGDASNGRSRIQVEENGCLLGNPNEPDQF